MGIANSILGLVLWVAAHPLVGKVGDVDVDFGEGTLMAQGAAAADLRMPGPSAARPRAERQARTAADRSLASALDGLVKSAGGMSAQALKSQPLPAETVRIEYQSNGGVVLWRKVRVDRLVPAASSCTFAVAAMPMRLFFSIKAGLGPAVSAFGVYRSGKPPQEANPAAWDAKQGLIVDEKAFVRCHTGKMIKAILHVERPMP